MSKIDLGRKISDMIAPDTGDRNEAHYPCLHIDDVEDRRLAEMPDSGEMTVRYKIRNRTHNENTRKDGKKHTCSVTLEITHVDPPPKPKKKNGDSDGGARKAFSDYWKSEDKK